MGYLLFLFIFLNWLETRRTRKLLNKLVNELTDAPPSLFKRIRTAFIETYDERRAEKEKRKKQLNKEKVQSHEPEKSNNEAN